MGVINVPFAIPNIRIENPEATAHTRIGWFRSVSNIPHAFAVQSFVAELAAAADRDPKDYLLEVIGPARGVSPQTLGDTWNHGESPERYPVDTGRLRRVVRDGGARGGMGQDAAERPRARHRRALQLRDLRRRRRRGGGRRKGELTIPRVDIAIDCGATVNPDRVRAQMEGACVMGVGVATLGEIRFKNGRAEQDNFDTYEVTRMPRRRARSACTSSPATTTSRSAASASPACRRCRRRCATRSSPRRASGSGGCPSAIS